jgi:hypothetical protein
VSGPWPPHQQPRPDPDYESLPVAVPDPHSRPAAPARHDEPAAPARHDEPAAPARHDEPAAPSEAADPDPEPGPA